jgi:hypothetical protein
MCDKIHSESGTETIFNPCNEYVELKKKYEMVCHERDVYKAVLIGGDYQNIDSLPKMGVEHAKFLGETVKELTIKTIVERDKWKNMYESLSVYISKGGVEE